MRILSNMGKVFMNNVNQFILKIFILKLRSQPCKDAGKRLEIHPSGNDGSI
jgi:hypothetical protein